MQADYFSSSLAHHCFALLSDKARERTYAQTSLRSVLPDDVKNGRISVIDARKLLQGYMDWVEYEFRLFRKDSSKHPDRLQMALKDLKWILNLLSSLLEKSDFNTTLKVSELLQSIMVAFPQFLVDVATIFNSCLFNKASFLCKLKDPSNLKLIEKIVSTSGRHLAHCDSSALHEIAKLLCFISTALPYEVTYDSNLFSVIFTSLSSYLRRFEHSRSEPQYLALVFGSVNALFLSNYDLIALYHRDFVGFALLWFRTRNSQLLQKLLTFFMIKNPLDGQLDILKERLVDEIRDPFVVGLHSGSPVKFLNAYEMFSRGEMSNLHANEALRCSFVTMCIQCLEELDETPPILAFFDPFKSLPNLKLKGIDPLKSPTFREWTSLAEYVISGSIFKPELLEVEDPLLSWFKISSSNCTAYDSIDRFLERFFEGNSTSALDPYVLIQISRYLQSRYRELWWTSSAEKTMLSFCRWIRRLVDDNSSTFNSLMDVDWYVAFASCLLAPFEIDSLRFSEPLLLSDTQRSLSSWFDFYNLLSDKAERKLERLVQAPEPILQIVGNLLSEFSCENIQTSRNGFAIIKWFIDLNSTAFPSNQICDSFSVDLFSRLISANLTRVSSLPLTGLLSCLIPLMTEFVESLSNQSQKENKLEVDSFSAQLAPNDDISSSNIHLFRFGARPLNAIEACILQLWRMCNNLIDVYSAGSDVDTRVILNDWKLFLHENLQHNQIENVKLALDASSPTVDYSRFVCCLKKRPLDSVKICEQINRSPFFINITCQLLAQSDLALILDAWISFGKCLSSFPLLDKLRDNLEYIQPSTICSILCQEGIENEFFTIFGKENLIKYVTSKFDYIYAKAIVLQHSGAKGHSLLEDCLKSLLGAEDIHACLRLKSLQTIAYIIVIGAENWSHAVASLKFMASKLKVSVASDFSELIHPVHAVQIIPIVAKNYPDISPLIKLFNQVPLLQKFPQLLNLAYNHLSGDSKSAFAKYADSITPNWNLDNLKFDSRYFKQCNYIEFLLRYCDFAVWRSKPEAAGKLLYFILNFVNKSGKKINSLDSFDLLENELKTRLKLFDVAPNARIFLQSPKLKDDGLDCNSSEPFSTADLVNSILCILKTNNSSLTPECVEFLSSCELAENDAEFAKLILSFLFKNSIIEGNRKQLFQQLHNRVQLSKDKDAASVWMDIIESVPAGQGFVAKLFQSFPSDTTFLQQLIELNVSIGRFDSALYLYSLSLEQPRNREPLNLELLENIYNGMDCDLDDYLLAVRKRMRQFDSNFSDLLSSNSLPDGGTMSPAVSLLSDTIFLTSNVAPILNLNERKFSSWLFKLSKEDPGDFSERIGIDGMDEVVRLLRSVSRDRRQISPESVKMITSLITTASEFNFQIAKILPYISPKFENISKFIQADIASRILWERDTELALGTAKHAASIFPPNFPDQLRALLLCRIGEWAGQSKMERPSYILTSYLDKAMRIVEEKPSSFSSENIAHVHLIIAKFVDEQYAQVTKSDELNRRALSVSETRAALDSCRSNLTQLSSAVPPEERKIMERNVYELNQQYQADQDEYSRRLKDRNTFLMRALSNYISALSFGSISETEQIATISRVCALWFQHHEESTVNEIVNSSIPGQSSRSGVSASIKKVPVGFYLPLIYQLAARASYTSQALPSEFQKVLLRLLVQMLMAHPFDCIYQLLALRSGNQSEPSSSQSKRRKLVESHQTSSDNEAEGRAAAAAMVINQVRKCNSELSVIISSVEALCEAYIELANFSLPETESRSLFSSNNPLPSHLQIKKLLYPLPEDSAFKKIPIATCAHETAMFAGFTDSMRVLRGINLPKLIEVISVSGTRHKQLVKGNDDVRQDAVMEQVFQRVNQLLKDDLETRRRKLSMRTYRVIPLRPLVGLIEFVSDSTTFSEFLKNAHERIRPGDLKPDECRQKLQAEHDRPGSTVQSKLNVLSNEIAPRFKPVFRYFFFEHFQISNWWPAREAYIRSMAVGSILGWIVGLGDRHGMNILLDKSTGEVIHIDLNMIFETGKTLRIPERVPFRLTPDCVDGMGPERLGLEGLFKNNAISVLKVLRRERTALMMVLDVFKYDPLQKWTGMAAVAKKDIVSVPSTLLSSVKDPQDSTFVAKAADRALQRIREKLEGREDGSILSEAGHVSYLMQTAMDPELLCQMFTGWQAYF